MQIATCLECSNNHQYTYRLCGLTLISNTAFALPKAPQSFTSDAELRFTLKSSEMSTDDLLPNKIKLGNIKNGAGQPSITVYRADHLYLLDCHNTQHRIQFVMSRDEGWIDCYRQNGTTKAELEVWLFGLVLAFLLQDRGVFSLHAAAVACRGRALAFIGHNGYGKSTLASFFLQKGHSLITDDILPLVEKDNSLIAMPVCPAMNLWSQTLAQLKKPRPIAPNDQSNISKRRYSLKNLKLQFAKSEAPLGAIYFLRPTIEAGHPVRITPIPKARSLIELLSNTRANSMIEGSKQKQLLKTYADLVSRIPVCQLEYTRGFDLLPKLYDEIINHNFQQRAHSVRPSQLTITGNVPPSRSTEF